MDLSLTSTSLWKRLVAKLKVSRASPVRTTSWLLQRGAVLDFAKKGSNPIVFLKSAMRTRGSGRARREANAVQWRTFGFDVIVRWGME